MLLKRLWPAYECPRSTHHGRGAGAQRSCAKSRFAELALCAIQASRIPWNTGIEKTVSRLHRAPLENLTRRRKRRKLRMSSGPPAGSRGAGMPVQYRSPRRSLAIAAMQGQTGPTAMPSAVRSRRHGDRTNRSGPFGFSGTVPRLGPDDEASLTDFPSGKRWQVFCHLFGSVRLAGGLNGDERSRNVADRPRHAKTWAAHDAHKSSNGDRPDMGAPGDIRRRPRSDERSRNVVDRRGYRKTWGESRGKEGPKVRVRTV